MGKSNLGCDENCQVTLNLLQYTLETPCQQQITACNVYHCQLLKDWGHRYPQSLSGEYKEKFKKSINCLMVMIDCAEEWLINDDNNITIWY